MRNTIAGILLAVAAIGCDGAPETAELTDTPPPRGDGVSSRLDASKVIGDSCVSSDPDQRCVALKYVADMGDDGEAVISRDQAIAVVRELNSIWRTCGVRFQIDEYVAAKARDRGLPHRARDMSDLDAIRSSHQDGRTLLVAVTETWDRGGSLGGSGANAWTNMPGGNVHGAVLERPVSAYANIVAHELGHYLGLDHVHDPNDLMNPVIHESSNRLHPGQCETARAAVDSFWPETKR